MIQTRVAEGQKHEIETCLLNGWKHVNGKPRFYWGGIGRSNIEKIYNADFDATKFLLTDKSLFTKYDAIDQDGNNREIKKYFVLDASKWTLYSEPVFCIKTKGILAKAIKLLGNGDINVANTKYNKFLDDVIINLGQDIITKMTSTNIGIQFIDGFIPQDKIEYRWKVNTGWKGFNRISIEFRVK